MFLPPADDVSRVKHPPHRRDSSLERCAAEASTTPYGAAPTTRAEERRAAGHPEVDPETARALWVGFDRPVASNADDAGKAKNRRVEIVLSENA